MRRVATCIAAADDEDVLALGCDALILTKLDACQHAVLLRQHLEGKVYTLEFAAGGFKHDSFIEHDGKGGMVEEFSGKLLVQQEPDASSFPSGGIRSTFEARGYSAWDPTSPVFIIEDTLCIPTVFISYSGEALDYKAPLLRALHAVNVAATDVCHYFDPSVKKVTSNLGWEQEYFLVDDSLWPLPKYRELLFIR